MAALNGRQIEQLQQAIVSAFDRQSFAQLLLFKLDRRLDEFEAPDDAFPAVVLKVITAAERVPWTADLLRAVAAAATQRADLQPIFADLLAHLQSDTPAPPLRPGSGPPSTSELATGPSAPSTAGPKTGPSAQDALPSDKVTLSGATAGSAVEGPVLSAVEGGAAGRPSTPGPETGPSAQDAQQKGTLSAAEGPVLSGVEGPVLSGVEGPVLSEVEGPVLSGVEGSRFTPPVSLPSSAYLDFDIEIGPGKGRNYPVAVLRSPAGEARVTMRFPYGELQLDNALLNVENALLRSGGKRRKALTEEQKAVRDFGQTLFDALLTGEARSRYDISLERARQAGQGLRVRLRFQAPDLAALPWEFLHDAREGEYICLSTGTPLVRYLELPRPPQPLTVAPPLRVLGLVAAPANLRELDVENEKQRVEEALASLRQAGTVELVWLEQPTWRELQRAMRGGPWHIFHFIGHGMFDETADEGTIYLETENRLSEPLSATQVGRLLADHRSLRLAVLNACEGARGGKRDIFSSTASILVQRGLPAVLAMQYEITDRAAIELARAFYEALADGWPVDAAVAEARKAVSLAVANTVEWGTPVLYMRSPDGVLFNIPPRRRRDIEQLFDEALYLFSLGDYAKALQLFRQVKRLAPEYPHIDEYIASAIQGVQHPRVVAEAAPTNVTDAPRTTHHVAHPDRFVIEHPIRMEFVRVPAGPFLMGSDKSKDNNADDNELPQHTVEIESDYYIGKYPVTNAQYAAFVSATKHEAPAHWKSLLKSARIPSGKEDHPVVNVIWHDAIAFAAWLSQQTGKAFRLPTEAEWEKAARGADGRIYPWGDRWDAKRANTREGGPQTTTPVGAYSSPGTLEGPGGDSPYGCADMAGNVWEWTGSLYRPYPYDPGDGREDLQGGGPRVVRGGSWLNRLRYARAASRLRYVPDPFNDCLGFRVALSLSS